MNLLHLFMLMLFVIGILLIIITFYAYSKLNDKCTSNALRTKLRISIGIGTAFVTMSFGYAICVRSQLCNCEFGERSNIKLYVMLFSLMSMGIGLLILTLGIKSDLTKGGCDVDLGIIPDVLTVISIIQIVIPVLYIVYIYKKTDSDEKNIDNEKYEQDDDDDDDDDRHTREEMSYKSSQLERDIRHENKKLSSLRKELRKREDKLRKSKKDLSSVANVKAQKSLIASKERKIDNMKKEHSKLESQLSSGSISSSEF